MRYNWIWTSSPCLTQAGLVFSILVFLWLGWTEPSLLWLLPCQPLGYLCRVALSPYAYVSDVSMTPHCLSVGGSNCSSHLLCDLLSAKPIEECWTFFKMSPSSLSSSVLTVQPESSKLAGSFVWRDQDDPGHEEPPSTGFLTYTLTNPIKNRLFILELRVWKTLYRMLSPVTAFCLWP